MKYWLHLCVWAGGTLSDSNTLGVHTHVVNVECVCTGMFVNNAGWGVLV